MSEEKLNEALENEEEVEWETITLIDDEGNENEFVIDDEFDFEEKHYLVLCENEDSDDAFLFTVEEDSNEQLLIREVEDDDEFERVSEFYFNS